MNSGINGPIFVTIGDSDKLNKFLKENPNVPRESIFADDLSFGAYNAVGLGSVAMEKASEPVPPPEGMGFDFWRRYLWNILGLSPIPRDGSVKLGQVPEGVLRLGGTFVVNGDDVLYQWSDSKPGDHPKIGDVMAIAKEAVQR